MRPRIAFKRRDILPKRRENTPLSKAPPLRGENNSCFLSTASLRPAFLIRYAAVKPGENGFKFVPKFSQIILDKIAVPI